MWRIEDFKNKIKWTIQRARRGYSDDDVWNIDSWFLEIMPKMLKQFRDTSQSAPFLPKTTDETRHEEWKNIIGRMIFLLQEMNEDTCSFENVYKEAYFKAVEEANSFTTEGWKAWKAKYAKLSNDYYRQEALKDIYIRLKKEEFFDMFCRYFYDLWD